MATLVNILHYHVLLQFLSWSDLHALPPLRQAHHHAPSNHWSCPDNFGSVNLTRNSQSGVISIYSPAPYSPSNTTILSLKKNRDGTEKPLSATALGSDRSKGVGNRLKCTLIKEGKGFMRLITHARMEMANIHRVTILKIDLALKVGKLATTVTFAADTTTVTSATINATTITETTTVTTSATIRTTKTIRISRFVQIRV
ncbi:hypothetical protein HKD37_01G000632 [Glycine soja]